MLAAWFSQLFGRSEAATAPVAPEAGSDPLSTSDLEPLVTYSPTERDRALEGLDLERAEQFSALVLERASDPGAQLPVFPRTASEIIALLDKMPEELDLDQLMDVLSRDPGVCVDLLRFANSPAYGSRNEILSIRDAVVRIGLTEVTRIAAAAATRTLFDDQAKRSLRQLRPAWAQRWHHAQTSGFTAAAACRLLDRGDSSLAFVGGLLHDVGKLLSLRCCSRLLSGTNKPPLEPATLAHILEQTHLPLGVMATKHWGMPPRIIEVCARHHDEPPEDDTIALIQLVSGLYHVCFDPLRPDPVVRQMKRAAHGFGLNRDQLKELVTTLTTQAELASAEVDNS